MFLAKKCKVIFELIFFSFIILTASQEFKPLYLDLKPIPERRPPLRYPRRQPGYPPLPQWPPPCQE